MKITRLILSAIALFILAGCTRNDGDIGHLFGQWKLVSITRNGVDDPSYEGNIYWSFQNSTLEMKEVVAHNTVYQTFGNWHETDNTLFFSFPDHDYPPRPSVGLPREAELQIIKLDSGSLILSYGDPATIYTFRKW